MHIQSHHPNQNTRQMHKAQITHSQSIVLCGNTPVITDFLEKTFNPAPFFILSPVYIPWFGCVRFWRNTVRYSRFFDLYPKVCRSVCFVCHDNGTEHIHYPLEIPVWYSFHPEVPKEGIVRKTAAGCTGDHQYIMQIQKCRYYCRCSMCGSCTFECGNAPEDQYIKFYGVSERKKYADDLQQKPKTAKQMG